MKVNWRRTWAAIKGIFLGVLSVCFLAYLVLMICYFIADFNHVVVHDNGCERVMSVYSQTGELLETYVGYIGILRIDGDTTVYDWDGSCITVQGAIVTVQDIN